VDTVRAPRSFAARVEARRVLLAKGTERIVSICRRMADVRAVYIFGSYARGEVGTRSDLDVLIVRETKLRRLDRDLDLRLAFDVPIGIDIIVVTPSELTERLPLTGFGQTILREARKVYAA